jgi:hypothetical protein
MKCLTLFLLICTSNVCFAQMDSASIKFIRNVIHKKNILYNNRLDKYEIKEMREKLNEDTLSDFMSGKIVVLSGEEKAKISKGLDAMTSMIWKDGILDNSKALNKNEYEKLKIKKVTNGHNWFSFPKEWGGFVYTFSKPIFFRNNTLCVFYFGYQCGDLCGTWILSIFVNQARCGLKSIFLTKRRRRAK